MRKPFTCLLVFWCCLGWNSGISQQLDHVQGEVLIQLASGEDPWDLLSDLPVLNGSASPAQPLRAIAPSQRIWLLSFDHTSVNELLLLAKLRSDERVQAAQFNHFLQSRTTVPNDPFFAYQWPWYNTGNPGGLPDADIDATEAWDHTTGGLTPAGDTIVVAVIDDGTDPDHPDLAANLWRNYAEIPYNNIDDDDNGYIDDHWGWNVSAGIDLVQFGSHGVKVSGLIGAVGDNQTGIAGVNWNVKILNVVGITTVESEVLAGFEYVLQTRLRYNQSEGAEGAFVVALNTSWGVDGGQPDDAPLWCAFYDALGQAGILSCASTANHDWNIDQVGDLPTSCTSDYLITVTATDWNDERDFAAYGPTTVDLAAPGKLVYTTKAGGEYGPATGTSFAAPQVAGLAALLYSGSCDHLTNLAKADPPAAVKFVKDLLMSGVDTLPQLVGEILSGGRLNASHSLERLLDNCSACPTPAALGATIISSSQVQLHWVSLVEGDVVTLRWRAAGTNGWQQLTNPPNPLTISNLNACSEYEFQVRSSCLGADSDFSESAFFVTDGCCVAPENIGVQSVSASQAYIEWDPVLAAFGYILRWKSTSAVSWQAIAVEEPQALLSGLLPCTNYEFQLRTLCGWSETDYTDAQEFSTPGCGNCIELPYCDSYAADSGLEWIQSVTLGSQTADSGNNDGYHFCQQSGFVLWPGGSFPLTIEPGYSVIPFEEHVRAWIDYDHDGEFSADELVLSTGNNPVEGAITQTIVVPPDLPLGPTRMRVSLRWAGDPPPGPCQAFQYGEVEDLCLVVGAPISPPDFCAAPIGLDTVSIDDTAAELSWQLAGNALYYQLRWRAVGSGQWSWQSTLGSSLKIDQLTPCLNYEVQLRQFCQNDTSAYGVPLIFRTPCSKPASVAGAPDDMDWRLFPNPFSQDLHLKYAGVSPGKMHWRILTVDGRQLQAGTATLHGDTGTFTFPDAGRLPAGLYWIQLQTGQQSGWFKVIKP